MLPLSQPQTKSTVYPSVQPSFPLSSDWASRMALKKPLHKSICIERILSLSLFLSLLLFLSSRTHHFTINAKQLEIKPRIHQGKRRSRCLMPPATILFSSPAPLDRSSATPRCFSCGASSSSHRLLLLPQVPRQPASKSQQKPKFFSLSVALNIYAGFRPVESNSEVKNGEI